MERDPTKFVSLEDYQAGVGMLKTYLARRMESVQGQISGSIPATKAGQAQNPEALVPSSDIDLHLLGDVTMGFFDSSVQFNPFKGK